MLATYMPPEKTPFSEQQASEALRWAMQDDAGATLSNEALALGLAKSALETGRWKSIWNNNWGNVKAGPDYEGWYTCIVLNEVLIRDGVSKLVWFAPEGELTASPSKGGKVTGKVYDVPSGHPQTRMRHYANRFDGALSYVRFVRGGRYAHAYAALLAGDSREYVRRLKAAKYFTADETKYHAGVASIQREFLRKLKDGSI